MNDKIVYRRFTAAERDEVAPLLTDVYAEVYGDRLQEVFFALDRFSDRLRLHTDEPRWECVVGYDGAEAVGYAYGASRRKDSNYWQTVEPMPRSEFSVESGQRTFVLYELMIRTPWRGLGVSRELHDELVSPRDEERVSLVVEHQHPRVRALYETWAYKFVGVRALGEGAPLLDVMVLERQ